MKKLILTGILMAFCIMPSEAQILNKLKKKIQQRVENTVTDKVADKAAEEAGKSMDSLLYSRMGNSGFRHGV